jgi:predicted nucleic acid-binding protein
MEPMGIETICLDTDILIDELRGDPETVRLVLELESEGAILATTTVNAFELIYDASKTRERARNRDAVEKLQDRLVVYELDLKAAIKSGEVVAQLEAEGRPIDFRDAFIGAIASVNGSVLLTKNVGHFGRIPGLKLRE